MFQRVSQAICFLQLYIYFQLNFDGICASLQSQSNIYCVANSKGNTQQLISQSQVSMTRQEFEFSSSTANEKFQSVCQSG